MILKQKVFMEEQKNDILIIKMEKEKLEKLYA